MKVTTFGLDVGKRVYHSYCVEVGGAQSVRKKFKRDEVLEYFANREPAIIAMEACGSAHHLARQLAQLGHEVRLIAPHFVRPFVRSNKTDAADAQAIWEAAQRPDMRFVAVKSEAQQAVLSLHRVRQQLLKMRTMQTNQVRGLLYEFGLTLPVGWRKGMAQAQALLGQLQGRLPGMVLETLAEQLHRIHALQDDLSRIEQRLRAWHREQPNSLKLESIPGIGYLAATAAVATIGQVQAFDSGRQLAASLGIVPRQSGTGGRVRLLGISKRGDTYLRTLLIHGARALLARSKKLPPWAEQLIARRGFNVAAVAQANKMARTIWALLAHDRTYQKDYVAALAP